MAVVKLLDRVREQLRLKHYSYRTEETYLDWVRRYILFHQKRHPEEMGAPEIQAFITHLATQRNVAASTHTVPAVGAGETRPSPQSSSSIVKYSTRRSSPFCFLPPSVPNASPPSSPAMKPCG